MLSSLGSSFYSILTPIRRDRLIFLLRVVKNTATNTKLSIKLYTTAFISLLRPLTSAYQIWLLSHSHNEEIPIRNKGL
jgi:hypothetical protein